ncbi:MAG: CoB--CoM heterodisulfide reductase iron-sulfur subunit B family protein, partial [Thermoplasmata archaeon]|nr:CoB--CoM heterodisulfide reductase iron-sulfur subunit B family protein [Thermoplasmata archaeon]
TLKTSAKNLEKSAFAIAEALGHEMKEMDDWTCCGVVSSLTDDDLMHHLAPIRNLIHAEDEEEETIVTLCDMCCNTLKQTNLRVKDNPDNLETLNDFMDKENDYKNTVSVLHFLEFLRDEVGFAKIKKMVKHPLKGMKIMPYYGCVMLRPREVAIDDAEEPVILSDLLKALGAEVLDNPYKIECCGSYHTIDQKESTSKRAYRISNFGKELGADAIITSCPLCRYNLDVRGQEAEALFEGYSQMPTFYYTQLIAIALGLDIDNCGFENHAVDPIPLLKKKGVVK